MRVGNIKVRQLELPLSRTLKQVKVKMQLIVQIEVQVRSKRHLIAELCSTCSSAMRLRPRSNAFASYLFAKHTHACVHSSTHTLTPQIVFPALCLSFHLVARMCKG